MGGLRVAFNGTKGRLEHKVVEASAAFGSANIPGAVKDYDISVRVQPLRKPAYAVEPRAGKGSHGGGDVVMLADLFSPTPGADPLLRAADERSGAYSILVGVAANRCFTTGETVRIADLVARNRVSQLSAHAVTDRARADADQGLAATQADRRRRDR